MDKIQKSFQIRDLLEITKNNKYEACVATFEIVENLHKLDLDLKKLGWKTNKVAVIAMMALAKGIVKYDYITDEQREKLEKELKEKTPNIYLQKAESLFKKSKKIVETEEDLSDEDIGETLKEDLSSVEDKEIEEYESDNEELNTSEEVNEESEFEEEEEE